MKEVLVCNNNRLKLIYTNMKGQIVSKEQSSEEMFKDKIYNFWKCIILKRRKLLSECIMSIRGLV